LLPYIKQTILEVVEKTFGIRDFSCVVEHPENVSFGDYATNVGLVLSKIINQSPMEIANKLSYELREYFKKNVADDFGSDIFESIETVSPGFINFKLSPEWLNKLLIRISSGRESYGVAAIGNKKRIALEHSNVNPNKAAHIGHLRNACIGQFIERVYERLGFEVEVQYYANNVGVQVTTSMMGMEKMSHLSPTSYKKFDHFAWAVYSEMESKISQDEALQQERLGLLKKLEDIKSPESIEQRELANKILLEQLKTFKELGIDYDVIIYESDILATRLWEKTFERLKTNPGVYLAESGQSKGCWLVRLGDDTTVPSPQEGFEDVEKDKIIVRSNGVATYTGKDIAYHMWKFGLLGVDFSYRRWSTGTQNKELWTTLPDDKGTETGASFSGVDRVINVIGVEQTYAIEVVKKSLEYLGFEAQASKMKHVNYGFVFLSRETAEMLGIDITDGKKFYAMSGRKGWGVKIDDLIEMTDEKLINTYGNFESVREVRNGAIKFQMLKLNTYQDLIFDLNEALDLKGYSGPYIQYAYVRANSVLQKASDENLTTLPLEGILPLQSKEMDLLRFIYRYPEVVQNAAENFSPNLLCDFLFELAKKFNVFYNDLPILNASSAAQKKYRLFLCQSVKDVIKDGLWLLGIGVPERM